MTGLARVRLEGSGESGTRSWFVLIEATIFSRSIEEMCGCFRDRFSAESLRRSSGRARLGHDRVERCSPSSEDTVSRLEERAGSVVKAVEVEVVEVDCLRPSESGVWRVSGAQQKDSRENNLQLRFSRRFPSSMACAHLCSTTLALVVVLS